MLHIDPNSYLANLNETLVILFLVMSKLFACIGHRLPCRLYTQFVEKYLESDFIFDWHMIHRLITSVIWWKITII